MSSDDRLVERLIAYWRGDPTLPEESRWLCRKLSEGLARSLPAEELVAIQEDPQRHRQRLDLLLPALISPPAPQPAAGIHQQQTVTGDGNAVLANTGNVSGSLHVQARPRLAPRHLTSPVAAAKTEGTDTSIRILFLGANPKDSVRLRLDEEVREIDQALARADLGNRFELRQKWAVRGSDLQFHLLRNKPGIVHFSGHGSEENALFLESDQGESRPVTSAAIARLFAQFNRHIRCVVLNACYSHDQAAAIAEHIDCVVGMSTEVVDRVAIRFAASFYQALAFGCSVQAAFDMSCADLDIGDLGQTEVPRLLSTRCDPESVRFVQPE